MLLLEDKIAKVVNKLNIPDQYGKEDIDDYDDDCVLEYLYEALHAAGYNGRYREGTRTLYADAYCGVSKAAIILPDSSYVIKVPFNGYWHYEEYYNEEDDCYEYSDDCDFVPFEGGADGDYCEAELSNYLNALEDGFGDMFARTIYYGKTGSTPLYLQEKVYVYDDADQTSRHPSNDSLARAERMNKDEHIGTYNYIWDAAILEFYGEDYYRRFFRYLHDNGIDEDLHCGNVGFREDGSPVILDSAGWTDSY